MTPLLHIGWHKTATTWLQREVFSPGLGGFSALAPLDAEGRGDPMFLGGAFLPGPGLRADWGGRLASPFDFDAQAVRSEAQSYVRDGRTPVLSHEDLVGHMLTGGINAREVAERLHAVFPHAKILITIREQTALIHSSHGHFLRAGGVAGLRRFLTTYNEYQTPIFAPETFRFHRLTAHYQARFGARNVRVMPYEAFRADPAAFLAELQAFAGASGDLSGAAPERRANAESAAYDWLHRALPWLGFLGSPNNLNARAAIGSSRWKGRAFRVLSRAVPERWAARRLAARRARIEEILGPDYYAQSNAELQRLTGLDLGRWGYALPS